jgi:hypothetical protein
MPQALICSTPPLPSPSQLTTPHRYDEWFKNMHNFDDYLAARSQLAHATEPSDPLHNPYTWTHKQDGTPVWAIMAQDPEKIQTFQVGMAGHNAAIPVVGHFDFGLLASKGEGVEGEEKEKRDKERVQLVDVGGGHGACLRQILERHKELDAKRCVLQDRPDVVEMARAGGGLPEGVVLMAHDFRTEQLVKGELLFSPTYRHNSLVLINFRCEYVCPWLRY